MDGNRDEAARCVEIAKAAIDAGNATRARKFASIAQRLNPDSDDVVDLFAKLSSSEDAVTVDSSSKISEWPNDESEVFKDTASSSTTSGSSDPTPEQVAIVALVNRTVDYYEVLGLKKGCSEDEIRRAYRKLSLKVHPDKNKASGAEDAFKAVSKAFQCLSNGELRQKYDLYGPDEEIRNLGHEQQHGMRRRRRNHEEMFDPDEIFQAFFFGGQGVNGGGFQRRHFVRTQGMARGQNAAGVQSSNMIGIVHLLLVVAVFLLTYLPSSQPSYYSLEKVTGYEHPMATKERGVTYYVKSHSFEQEFPLGSDVRNGVERQVEREYRDFLLHNCRRELNLRSWGQIRDTPHCKKLEQFQRYVY